MQPEDQVKSDVETKPNALTLPETKKPRATKPKDETPVGVLTRDTWGIILNHGSPNLWHTMRGVNRYFRFQYQFPWHLQGLNIKTSEDFLRCMEPLKRTPHYHAVLGGKMTMEQAWVQQSNLTNALSAMGVTRLRDFYNRVEAVLRVLPNSDYYQVSELVPLLQNEAFLIDVTALANRQNLYITHAGLCMLLKGYINHKNDYNFLLLHDVPTRTQTHAYNAVLTLFDEHYLMPKTGSYDVLASLLKVDPDNLLVAFRGEFLKQSDLERYGLRTTYSQFRSNWNPSCLSFLFGNDGIAALQNGWITRADLDNANKGDPRDLMKIYLARRYPDVFENVSPASLSDNLLAKFFDPKRPQNQQEKLIELFRSQTLIIDSFKENSNIPLDDLLSVQDLLKEGYITTEQLNSLVTAAADKRTNQLAFEALSRLLKCMGSPNSILAFRDKLMTYDKLLTTLRVSGLQTTLDTLPKLFDNHAKNKATSELNRLSGLKTQLSTLLKNYTKHSGIYHRKRAELLAKTLDNLLPLEEMKKLINTQLDLYNKPRRPFSLYNKNQFTSHHSLFQGLRHRTKGWVGWTFHKTLLKCQKAIQEHPSQPIAVNNAGPK